jgi:hypothetical protein
MHLLELVEVIFSCLHNLNRLGTTYARVSCKLQVADPSWACWVSLIRWVMMPTLVLIGSSVSQYLDELNLRKPSYSSQQPTSQYAPPRGQAFESKCAFVAKWPWNSVWFQILEAIPIGLFAHKVGVQIEPLVQSMRIRISTSLSISCHLE